jgi:hypothetical protein
MTLTNKRGFAGVVREVCTQQVLICKPRIEWVHVKRSGLTVKFEFVFDHFGATSSRSIQIRLPVTCPPRERVNGIEGGILCPVASYVASLSGFLTFNAIKPTYFVGACPLGGSLVIRIEMRRGPQVLVGQATLLFYHSIFHVWCRVVGGGGGFNCHGLLFHGCVVGLGLQNKSVRDRLWVLGGNTRGIGCGSARGCVVWLMMPFYWIGPTRPNQCPTHNPHVGECPLYPLDHRAPPT